MSNAKKCSFGCYIKNLFKYCNLIPSLLLTALALTAIALNYEFHLFREFQSRKELFTLLIVAVAIMAFVGLGFLLTSIKNKMMTFADHLCFAMVLTAIGLLIYNFAVFNTVNPRPLYAIIALFVVGLIFMILYAKFFDETATSNEIIYTKNSMSGYFATVFRRYSFISIVVTAIISVCGLYLVLNPYFRMSILTTLNQHPALLYIMYIAMGLTGLYLISTAFSKNIVPADVLFLSSIISLPVTLAQIIIKYPKADGSFLAWAILTALVLLFGLVRFARFDVTVTDDKKLSGNYVKQLFTKYNLLLVLSVASIIVASVAIIYKGRLLQNSFNYSNGTFDPSLRFIILLIVGTAILVFGVWAVITSILNLKSSKITSGDLMLALLTVTALFALSFIAFSKIAWILITIACGLVICLVLLVIRIVMFSKKTHK